MTSRCNPITRASALLILILALFAIPSSTRAQQADCRCDFTTIAVDSDVNCKVTICYQLSPDSRPICIVIEPGTKVRIPCPVYEANIVTCTGNYPVISNSPVISRCTPSLSVPGFCCIKACRGADANGCALITISAASCLGRPCP